MRPEAREETVLANGLRLACKRWGDAKTVKPVLALHGWLDNAATFDTLAPALPGLAWCALDLPGHGLSQHRPAGAAYHFVDYVPDVLAVADALEWARFTLIGHSMGAGIATLLAAAAPERVERAVLIEGLGPATTAPGEAPRVLRRALADAQRSTGSQRAVYPTFDEAVRARMSGISKLSENAARLLCARGLERTPEGFVWRSDARLRSGSRLRMTEAHALAFVGAMRVPTLLIRADPGMPTDAAQQAARIAAHPDLRVARIVGSHHLHLEAQAEIVAQRIGVFLRGEDSGLPAAEPLS
jgi:pimeloyl-ACP methyl ester carboxylesterase